MIMSSNAAVRIFAIFVRPANVSIPEYQMEAQTVSDIRISKETLKVKFNFFWCFLCEHQDIGTHTFGSNLKSSYNLLTYSIYGSKRCIQRNSTTSIQPISCKHMSCVCLFLFDLVYEYVKVK